MPGFNTNFPNRSQDYDRIAKNFQIPLKKNFAISINGSMTFYSNTTAVCTNAVGGSFDTMIFTFLTVTINRDESVSFRNF